MPKLGDVLLSLAGKAGINHDHETVKQLQALPEILNFELPDDVANSLERNLLTSESAVVNPDVRSKIFAEALNGVDGELDKFVNDFGFDDAFKGEYKQIQKNTNEKLRKATGAVRKLVDDAKAQAKVVKDPKDAKEVEMLTSEITRLNQAADNLKRMHQTELENERLKNLTDKKEFSLKSTLAGKPLPKNGLSSEINILTARTLITQEMAKNGLVVNFDEAGNPVLKQRKDGADMAYFVDNKPVDYNSFIDGVLAQNKFVQVNDQADQSNGGSGKNQQHAQLTNGQPALPQNTSVLAEVDAQLAQLGFTV